MSNVKPIVLVPVRYFLPAYKAGGPVRTLKGMVEYLSGAYEFKILALDRDLGESSPFPSIRSGVWNPVGNAQVRYISPGLRLPFRLLKALRHTEFDILYLNSFFDPIFTLLPLLARRLGLVPRKPVIVAPRGELSPGALAQKNLKKRIFLRGAPLLGLYRQIALHASTTLEKDEIEKALMSDNGLSEETPKVRVARKLVLPGKLEIRVARDMARPEGVSGPRNAKQPGRLNAVFISRVAPKKNLVAVIEMLSQVRGHVCLDIYGPIDDSGYWRQCQQVIENRRLCVRYQGALPHEKVQETLSDCDAFVFPTLGENFGHVVLESLLAGCPVVMSDQTPWRELTAKKAGWDLPLREPERFIEVLQALTGMDDEAHRSWREGARALGLLVLNDEQVLADNQKLFQNLPGN